MGSSNYNPYGIDLYDMHNQKKKDHKKQEKILQEMIQELKRIDGSLEDIKSTIHHLLE